MLEKDTISSLNNLKDSTINNITNGDSSAYPATKEYLEKFSESLAELKVSLIEDRNRGDIRNIFESFEYYRNDYLEVFNAMINYIIEKHASHEEYVGEREYMKLVHDFFGSLQKYLQPLDKVSHAVHILNHPDDPDVFKFFSYDLFLHTGAILIGNKQFRFFNYLVENFYHYKDKLDRQRYTGCFPVFNNGTCYFIEERKQEFQLTAITATGNMIKKMSDSSSTDFYDIIQVDFILMLRAKLAKLDNNEYWWPATLFDFDCKNSTFEIFQQSQSKPYFDKIKSILCNVEKEDLVKLIEWYEQNDYENIPIFFNVQPNLRVMMGVDKLCTTF